MLSRRALIANMAAASAVGLSAGVQRALAVPSRGSDLPGSGYGGSGKATSGTARQQAAEAVGEADPRWQVAASASLPTAEPAERSPAENVCSGELPQSGPPPWDLLRPLAMGSLVARGWRVAELSAVEDGVCVLTLRSERGRSHRVHLCRNDGTPQGIVYSERFDLLVMNGGQGDLPTDEGLARAVAEVAHVLAANEGGRRQGEVVAELLPHAERLRRFAAVEGSRLR